MLSKKVRLDQIGDSEKVLTPTYASRELNEAIPRFEMPENEMLPRTAYNIVHD